MKWPLTLAQGSAIALISGVLAATTVVSPVDAQTSTLPGSAPTASPAAPRATPPASSTPAERRDGRTERQDVVDASQLEQGANSFTEGQIRSRLEDAGFTDVQGLRKDDHGFWRGQALRGGSRADVAVDFRGRIAAGAGVARLGTQANTTNGSSRSGVGTSGTATSQRPDGTAGNPPSTMTGRAVDRLQGETPRPDGTPGNPPGTAAGRAVDRATGSNTTGANPSGAPAR
jgi:hypothetical protein